MAKTNRPKPWDLKPSAPLEILAPRQSFLIICEGEQTEKNYFEAFRANKSVKDFFVKGEGMNTLSLVQEAIEIRTSKEKERGEAFDQAWCVFDRDDFPAQNFNAAINLAVREGFQVAYSNEAFEIWYLLHFDAHGAALSRKQYKDKLSEKLGFRYKKNSPNILSDLQQKGNEPQAMKFADNLIKAWMAQSDLNPQRDNPSTTVHFLVRELRNQSPHPPRDNALCHQVHQILRERAGVSEDSKT